MYRFGHYGVSLLVFAPVGFALVSLGAISLAFVTGATMLWLAMLPDVDHRLPGVPHRGPTHSLLFAALVGAVFAGVGAVLGQGLGLGSVFGFSAPGIGTVDLATFGFFLGALTVVAHLLGDAITPMGVNFLWPLSGTEFTLSLTPADSTLWNYGLFVLGVAATAATAVLTIRGF
ncbi:inner membrane protein [Halogranum gelatinilyticum]|uniref:Inner membrane protein n=1 Tax=Halogranum gelatinilyticum TaxID=660521 RepID=A0A1G9RHF2_9EURY|nr:metal-dependent hydrolase [Halogranum gelatinilyticum]SDM22623.1 inner membrane protein [Halogranum gelatinilyticum]